ncbi:hypothetical protein OAD85_08835, partial [Actinomycetota bacterium]|nr:hypothetical protein [Actinomycetota bacterium]
MSERMTKDMGSVNIYYRPVTQAGLDGLCWVAATLIATFLRYDGAPSAPSIRSALIFGIVLGLVQVLTGLTIQRFRGRRIIGSFDEISVLTFTSIAVAIMGTISLFLISTPPVPRSVPLIAGSVALTAMLGGRFLIRTYRQRSIFNQNGERVLIYGAGDSGEQIIRQMISTPSANFIPVAIIDDDPRKLGLRVQGIRVVGDNFNLEDVVRKTGASTLVVAIAAAESK